MSFLGRQDVWQTFGRRHVSSSQRPGSQPASAGLLLDEHRASSDILPGNKVAYFDLDEVATAQLAVDRQIEERSVSQTPLPIEKEANRPYLSRFQRAFRSDLLACIPCPATGG
ncbi:hypothetical protein Mesop_5090 [Mesorhizobium opportunistum WSM2075]|uniref:Uncharacterized protein n=1 Tax=Mesorhizobium opportunistum (strain LMG 24607 / HAMBI 3007 / WSM2075) TaxID=536019 RepID=F7Y3N9_MESOW|nr:hypothetical protein Mesop_5090 [Mesorhizobium opportunistum WSM2075]